MIVGLDLALTCTGWSTLDRAGALQWGTITPSRSLPMGGRLDHIRQRAAELVAGATLVAIEAPVVRTPAAVVLGQVHGVVVHRLWELEVAVLIVPPATLKMLATGKGNAPKPDVRGAARKRLGYADESDDEADACWLADLAARLLGWDRPPLPAGHLRALDKVTLPSRPPPVGTCQAAEVGR